MMEVELLSVVSSDRFRASAVFLPGSAGRFEVLPGHAPIISTLDKGEIRWRTEDGEEHSVSVSGGIMRFEQNVMKICTEL